MKGEVQPVSNVQPAAAQPVATQPVQPVVAQPVVQPAPVAAATPVVPATPVAPVTPTAPATPEIPVFPAQSVTAKKSGKMWWIIGGIIVALILVAAGYFLFMNDNNSEVLDSTALCVKAGLGLSINESATCSSENQTVLSISRINVDNLSDILITLDYENGNTGTNTITKYGKLPVNGSETAYTIVHETKTIKLGISPVIIVGNDTITCERSPYIQLSNC